MKSFPVLRLNQNINEVFQKLISMDIHKGIADGLDPIIRFIDEEGKVTYVAKISEDILRVESSQYFRHVTISAAYAQILWIICSVALRNHDSMMIDYEISKMSNLDKENFFKELEVDHPITRYLKSIIEQNTSFSISAEMVNMMVKIFSRKLSEDEMDRLYKELDMDSEYGIKVNSLYIHAMAFNLLHEFSHHYYKHDFTTDGTISEEIEADQNAFWSLYSDLDGAEKTSAMMGVLCSLVSLIFINYDLSDDGIHPKPIERIFEYYEIIKDENVHYCALLVHLLYVWAVFAYDQNVPPLKDSYEETLYQMKEYLISKENSNNN